jgi:hypothetical protein
MTDDALKPLGKHGGVRPGAGRPKKGESREPKNQSDSQSDHVTLNSRGNSADYIIARLRREGLDHWIEAIANRKISAFPCAVLLGWRQRPATVHGENHNKARKRAFDARALIG